ncbi:hypothetical protein PoB_005783500 [Plakobranchus ocellatus]|uniref:Uncharacterized protein n=1 Tax=Plakobranchus ocellatus TaxID=259542 RepID=A0AAV4CET8_9GAST|nr:hypothetical protein PoB_005783500 [Plakobranchus ocellatus]
MLLLEVKYYYLGHYMQNYGAVQTCMAFSRPKQGDLRLSHPPSGQEPFMELRPITKRFLQIAIHYITNTPSVLGKHQDNISFYGALMQRNEWQNMDID